VFGIDRRFCPAREKKARELTARTHRANSPRELTARTHRCELTARAAVRQIAAAVRHEW
tara:strand:+ start:125 stop:301 length:177 start_codon:yes stop_codon:yes gene_type:complete